MNEIKIRNFDDSLFYEKGKYGSLLYETIIKADRIDKTSPAFEDVRYTIKRNQYTSSLPKVLDSRNVVLLLPNIPMPRSLKVFTQVDVKEDRKLKVFVDCSGYIKYVDGVYVIPNDAVRPMVALLVNALNSLIYYSAPTRIINNTQMLNAGTSAFAKLAANIVDYMRIGSATNIRQKILYISALYYQMIILGKEYSDSAKTRAIKISGLSASDCDVLETISHIIDIKDVETYVNSMSRAINTPALKLDNFLDKWTWLYGSGTQFALELYPAFGALLTNAYLISGFNKQQQIEKIAGRDMVDFTNALFRIGSELR